MSVMINAVNIVIAFIVLDSMIYGRAISFIEYPIRLRLSIFSLFF